MHKANICKAILQSEASIPAASTSSFYNSRSTLDSALWGTEIVEKVKWIKYIYA